jgi:TrmH family RNA methyltransferase
MPEFTVVLVEPEFEESIGFVARAMKNFGLKTLRIVKPIAKLSVAGRMRAGHAQNILDSMTIHSSLTSALNEADLSVGTTAQTSHSTFTLLRRPISPRELGEVLHNTTGTVAILLGREGTGLSNNELGLCDLIVTIPAASQYQTMNLSHAAAIVFYELFQSRNDDGWKEVLADEATKRQILQFMSELAFSARLKEYKIGIATKALRNVMGRSAIRQREASVLAGLFRKISEMKTPNLAGSSRRKARPVSV